MSKNYKIINYLSLVITGIFYNIFKDKFGLSWRVCNKKRRQGLLFMLKQKSPKWVVFAGHDRHIEMTLFKIFPSDFGKGVFVYFKRGDIGLGRYQR